MRENARHADLRIDETGAVVADGAARGLTRFKANPS